MESDTQLPQYDREPGLVGRIAEATCEAHTIKHTIDLPPVDNRQVLTDEQEQFLKDRHTQFMQLTQTWEDKSC